jgi:iron complex transport system permease protein
VTQERKPLVSSLILVILMLVLLGAITISFMLGRYAVKPGALFAILFSRVVPTQPFWTDTMETVVFNIRLPRILMACLVGCCLSAAGAAYQGVFQNPMAAPDILGASSGAAFGAALAILLGASSRMIMAAAFVSSLFTVGLVYLISLRAKGNKVIGLILCGIMVSSLFSAGTSFIKLVADPTNQLPAITYWLMGSLSGMTNKDLAIAFLPMAIGLLALFLFRWRINILTLGDDEAHTIGINTNIVRLYVIIFSTLITAASVSVSGMIGWVGLVIPHLSRKIVGNNYKYLMAAAMIVGAIFLLLVDNVSRNLLEVEIPLGVLTAFIGAPFFIYLITRKGDAN